VGGVVAGSGDVRVEGAAVGRLPDEGEVEDLEVVGEDGDDVDPHLASSAWQEHAHVARALRLEHVHHGTAWSQMAGGGRRAAAPSTSAQMANALQAHSQGIIGDETAREFLHLTPEQLRREKARGDKMDADAGLDMPEAPEAPEDAEEAPKSE